MDRNVLSDESLVLAAQRGDQEATDQLSRAALRFAGGMVTRRGWAAPGMEIDDIVMDAMPYYLRALRDWDPGRGIAFRAFAGFAVLRGIQSSLTTANRLKNQPLNDASSLDEPLHESNPMSTPHERWDLHRHSSFGTAGDPLDALIEAEEKNDVGDALDGCRLSDLERQSLILFLAHGYTYVEIARRLGRHTKAVDNALRRALPKVRRYYESRQNRPAA